jgi:hypothetical protein
MIGRAAMRPSFRERLERLGPIGELVQVASGSPAVISIRPAAGRTVLATEALARRGLRLLRAKRAVEDMLERGGTTVGLPKGRWRAWICSRQILAAGVSGDPAVR